MILLSTKEKGCILPVFETKFSVGFDKSCLDEIFRKSYFFFNVSHYVLRQIIKSIPDKRLIYSSDPDCAMNVWEKVFNRCFLVNPSPYKRKNKEVIMSIIKEFYLNQSFKAQLYPLDIRESDAKKLGIDSYRKEICIYARDFVKNVVFYWGILKPINGNGKHISFLLFDMDEVICIFDFNKAIENDEYSIKLPLKKMVSLFKGREYVFSEGYILPAMFGDPLDSDRKRGVLFIEKSKHGERIMKHYIEEEYVLKEKLHIVCSHCNRDILIEEKIFNDYHCKKCYDRKLFTPIYCDKCRKEVTKHDNQLVLFKSQVLCIDCFKQNSIPCSSCKNRQYVFVECKPYCSKCLKEISG